ncbi:hypothetical protein BC829DRAFT_394942, partial [Chytridium lagenaria]
LFRHNLLNNFHLLLTDIIHCIFFSPPPPEDPTNDGQQVSVPISASQPHSQVYSPSPALPTYD